LRAPPTGSEYLLLIQSGLPSSTRSATDYLSNYSAFFCEREDVRGRDVLGRDGYAGSGDEIRDNVTRMRLHRSMLSFDHHVRRNMNDSGTVNPSAFAGRFDVN